LNEQLVDNAVVILIFSFYSILTCLFTSFNIKLVHREKEAKAKKIK